jgi:hypothetical protein
LLGVVDLNGSGMPEKSRGSVERIIGAFLPGRLAGPCARLHAAGLVPKKEAEDLSAGLTSSRN